MHDIRQLFGGAMTMDVSHLSAVVNLDDVSMIRQVPDN